MLVKDFSDAVTTDAEAGAYMPWLGAEAAPGRSGLVVEHLDRSVDLGTALLTFCIADA
ncbi:hypothetical protein [Streptomyces sp. NPDC002588]|uniref:hypothetical protein n=1 Tax=Streptomyces sp. NPDC002588 TaxID=3154419 RepID=UPI00333174F7